MIEANVINELSALKDNMRGKVVNVKDYKRYKLLLGQLRYCYK